MVSKSHLINFGSIFYQMLRADFTVFKSEVRDKIINSLIYSSSFIIISAYILPKFGIEAGYGVLMASGLVASVGTFELFMAVVNLVSDINGDKIINFYLTLPIPSWLIFVRMILYSALSCTILSIMTLLASKLLLWHEFYLTAINWFQLLVIIVLNTIFYGTFAIAIASVLKKMSQIANVWMRFIFPLYVFGGFQFTWYTLYSFSPRFAIINLLNPMLYGIEGMRSAILGQEGYLPFWYCAGALVMLTIACFIIGYHRLKKQLDFI